MLSDPRTFAALVAGLIRDEPDQLDRQALCAIKRQKPFEGSLDNDQMSMLLSLGLNDRDLDFMGPRQRQMVLDVLQTSSRKSAAA